MNSCTLLATKIIENARHFSSAEFNTGCIDYEDLKNFNQLPRAMLSAINRKAEEEGFTDIQIYFSVGIDIFYMYMDFCGTDESEEDEVNFEVTKDEMITHLANILEVNQKNPNLEISDSDDRSFSFKDLENDKKMKFYFPNW
jgi:hypothetical protein